MRRISQRRFDALCYVRNPYVNLMAPEVCHYETDDKSNLAIILFDRTDSDFGYVIFGRDSRRLFRCIKVGGTFFSTFEEAEAALYEAIKPYEEDGLSVYPQGDEKTPTHDIFAPVVSEDKQHDYFKVLVSDERRTAARNLIQEIAYSFVDVDGNYIEQFQSSGFDQRLWELFLYVLFYKLGFEINNSEQVPDFSLSRFGMPIFVEAVTVGPNPNFDIIPNSAAEIAELSKDYMPIKFGSALFSKVQRKKKKKYWELPHVAGHPFILAIHDYHAPATPDALGSMTWSRAGLVNYLYGVREEILIEGKTIRPRVIVGKDGLELVYKNITEHTHRGKTIPSRFFAQPDTEHVSAVLFSNGATITTFARMGKISGLGDYGVKAIRQGIWIAEDGETTEPFSADVDSDDYDEAWGDTVTMFHNPWAKNPVPEYLFPDISHAIFDPVTSRVLYSFLPKHVMTSWTFLMAIKPDKKT